MTDEDKQKFDKLNNTSYLLRLNLDRHKCTIVRTTLMDDDIWYVSYLNNMIGTITFRKVGENSFCNIRLYNYIKEKWNLSDFIMSDYYTFDEDGKINRFNFEKFDKYIEKIKVHFTEKQIESPETQEENYNIEDSISRLREYCDVDESFSKNVLIKDMNVLLKEYDRLKQECKKYSEKLMNLFLKVK